MNILKSFKLQQLRNGEYLQYLRDVIAFVTTAALPPAPPLEECLAALSGHEAAISALFGKDRRSALTGAIRELDARRDAAITGIRMIADAYTRHPAAPQREAGQKLSHLISLYGGIAGEDYNAESAELANLVQRLAQPEFAAAVALLHLTDWVAELHTASTAFAEAYAERVAKNAAAYTPDNIKALRVAANAALYALREKISGYYIINDGAEPWASLVGRLNALTAQYAQTLRVRKGVAKARTKKAGATDASQSQ